MAFSGSWRSELFREGRRYRVLKDWSGFGSSFRAGMVVTYKYCGYERYDNESLFMFWERKGLFRRKNELVWRIRDEEDDAKAREHFCEET
jgi:hypothetical protein